MRFSLYINQEKAMEWGLNANLAILFGYLHDLPTWGKAFVIDGEVYYWSGKDKIISELPLLTDKPDTIKRHMASLEKLGLIERKTHQNHPLVKITAKGKLWNKSEKEFNQVGKKIPTSGDNCPDQGGKNIPTRAGKISPILDNQDYIKDLSSSQNSSDDKIKSIPSADIQTPKGEKWGTKQDIDAVDWMYRRVRKVNEAARRPKLVNWANDIRLMRNALNVSHREICELFKFANEHHFWAENIQSPKALRKQWDKLLAQRNTMTRPAANEPDFHDTSWADNIDWEM
ncbi:hypothetical protein [Vibrio algivorus]|uniref:Replication protein n=1 Tax=Vibrio algivorus TaxID=1667024 RepID=A0A557P9P1_9VIBR|nr:hypothetical protein [Vibrio algivorus]TVO37370.1 hypothetical protein FOF44_07105 [Vibrio algivorus]